jgi:hypothetical protein
LILLFSIISYINIERIASKNENDKKREILTQVKNNVAFMDESSIFFFLQKVCCRHAFLVFSEKSKEYT